MAWRHTALIRKRYLLGRVCRRWLTQEGKEVRAKIQTEVLSRDRKLLLLKSDLNTRNLKPGHLLCSDGRVDAPLPLAVVAFSAFGYHFALQLGSTKNAEHLPGSKEEHHMDANVKMETLPTSKGQSALCLDLDESVLKASRFCSESDVGSFYSFDCDAYVKEVLEQPSYLKIGQEVRGLVFKDQPAGAARDIIKENLFTGIPIIDMLAPIGLGQSMFVDESSASVPVQGSLQGPANDSFSSRLFGSVRNLANTEAQSTEERILGFKVVDDDEPSASCNGDVPVFLFGNSSTSKGADSDVDADYYLRSFIACSAAEQVRDTATNEVTHSVLFLPGLAHFQALWLRAKQLAFKHYRETSAETSRSAMAHPVFGSGKDRGELRHFYSALIQRAALLNDEHGAGSLTIIHTMTGMTKSQAAPEKTQLASVVEQEQSTDALPDHHGLSVAELCHRGLLQDTDFQRLSKLELSFKKLGRPFDVTEALKKLNINLSADSVVETKDDESLQMHCEEIKSLSDGHLSVNKAFSKIDRSTVGGPVNELRFPIDPKNSLTRIGIGTNLRDFRDIRPKVLARAVGPLRLQLISLIDEVAFQSPQESHKVSDDESFKGKQTLQLWAQLFDLNNAQPLGLKEQVIVGYLIRNQLVTSTQIGRLLEILHTKKAAQMI